MRTTAEILNYLLNNSDQPVAKNFIAGSFLNAACGELLDSEEPATGLFFVGLVFFKVFKTHKNTEKFQQFLGRVWLKIVNSSTADVDLACSAAHNAFPGYVLNFWKLVVPGNIDI
jgi:hypothetical protein